MDTSASIGIILVVGIFLLVLLVLWIVLPFLVMNTNSYLRRLLIEQHRTNELLESMRRPREPSARVDPRR